METQTGNHAFSHSSSKGNGIQSAQTENGLRYGVPLHHNTTATGGNVPTIMINVVLSSAKTGHRMATAMVLHVRFHLYSEEKPTLNAQKINIPNCGAQ